MTMPSGMFPAPDGADHVEQQTRHDEHGVEWDNLEAAAPQQHGVQPAQNNQDNAEYPENGSAIIAAR